MLFLVSLQFVCFVICGVNMEYYSISALFCDITQRMVVILYTSFGTIFCSRNVGKELETS